MNKPMDKSTIMDVPDKHNGQQQGDGLTWRMHQKEILLHVPAPTGDHKEGDK